MIELTPTTALMLYLLITMGSLLTIWGYHHYFSIKKKIDLSESKLKTCEYCHFVYMHEVGRSISQCPQCKLLNKPKH